MALILVSSPETCGDVQARVESTPCTPSTKTEPDSRGTSPGMTEKKSESGDGRKRCDPAGKTIASHGGAAAAAYGRGGGAAGVRESVARGDARELRPQRSLAEP